MSVKKIVIIGPESTGKSTLTIQLAKHYNCNYVAEYARQYLENKAESYTIQDLDAIAIGQIESENIASANTTKLLFVDTNAYTIKIWSEIKYNSCSKIILDAIINNHYDYYLLMDIDLPWQYDPLREAPNAVDRLQLMHCYKDAILNSGVPFSIINGLENVRLQYAIHAIDSFLL